MIHVYPVDDLKEHKLEGTMCPCNPRVDWSEKEGIVIHNAWDFREVKEQLDKLWDRKSGSGRQKEREVER